MSKTTIAYGLLLVVAFVVGLCGTLVASRAVLRMQTNRVVTVDRPASAPAPVRRPRPPHSIDC